MKKYFNMGTRDKEDVCMEYSGIDPYNANGTVIASKRCKRCHNYVSRGVDAKGPFVVCKEER
ncbi:MAG: hypothetical protein WC455_30320 [Dehalococcoidia bacterium]|jgi:cytochrome c2